MSTFLYTTASDFYFIVISILGHSYKMPYSPYCGQTLKPEFPFKKKF